MTRLDGGEILRRTARRPRSARTQPRSPPASPTCPRTGSALGINLRQPVADNIAITVLDRLRDRLGMVAPERRHALARHWIAELNIRADGTAAAALTLSGGNQQRVVLGEMARHQAEDADPRRPDHRRRHPQQGRHPRGDPRARAMTAWRSS